MKISEICEKSQKIVNWMPSYGDLVREERKTLVLLYEFPAETRLMVYRRLDIRVMTRWVEVFFLLEEKWLVEQSSSCLESNTEPRWIDLTLDPRISLKLVVGLMISMMFYIMSYWFVTLKAI